MADEDITLDGKPLQSLRVADLKAALEQRNLSKSGQKNTLVKRLKGASSGLCSGLPSSLAKFSSGPETAGVNSSVEVGSEPPIHEPSDTTEYSGRFYRRAALLPTEFGLGSWLALANRVAHSRTVHLSSRGLSTALKRAVARNVQYTRERAGGVRCSRAWRRASPCKHKFRSPGIVG